MRGASSCFVAVCVWFAAFQAGCADSTADIFQSGVGGASGSTSAQTGVTSSQATNATNATSSVQATTNGPGPTTNAATTTNATSVVATSNVTTTNNVATSVSVQSSTSSGPPGNKVLCASAGNMTTECNVNAEVCCWDNQLMSGQCTQPDNCQPTTALSMPTAISCEFQFQCPGQICCAFRYNGQDNQPYDTAMCADTCDLPDRYLCNPQNPACPIYDSNGMQVQSMCKPSSLLPPGYYVCGF